MPANLTAGIEAAQTEWLANAFAPWFDNLLAEMRARRNASRSRPRPLRDRSSLDWDYDMCGSYRNSDWGE